MKKYILRKQIGNRGCYAEIEFELTVKNGVNNKNTYQYLGDLRWELPCKMGFDIFCDYFARRHPENIELIIHNVKWVPVDTNNLIVLFAVIKALSECLNFKLENLEFDTSNETFKFPEPRSINVL